MILNDAATLGAPAPMEPDEDRVPSRGLSWFVVVLLVAIYAAVSVAALAIIGNPYRAGLQATLSDVVVTARKLAGRVAADPAEELKRANAATADAKARIAAGDLAGATVAYEKRLHSLERLTTADPLDKTVQRDVYVTHMAMGLLAEATDHLPDARAHYRAAITTLRPVAANDPANAGWQNDLEAAQDRLDALNDGNALGTTN